jgi:hypothetical protein
MNVCEANKKVSEEVLNFILNVSDVKEESITDYLIWKWRELDARFRYLNVKSFTRHEESSTTGADFELELWLVGRSFHFPLVFQAKKFVKQFDSYHKKLNYPAGTKAQLTTLLNYAKVKKRLPFYVFYSIPDESTKTICGSHDSSVTGVFIADANTVKKFADGIYGMKISKNDLLNTSNPFHRIFCCPLAKPGSYFTRYSSQPFSTVYKPTKGTLPTYVNMLLDGRMAEMGKQETIGVIKQNELRVFRAVGVYDMRDIDEVRFGHPHSPKRWVGDLAEYV